MAPQPARPDAGSIRRPSDGKPVDRMAIVFCVGSRNRRIGAPFCSRICCSYSTKQALTVIDRNPRRRSRASTWTCAPTTAASRRCTRSPRSGASAMSAAGSRAARSCPGGDIVVRAENTLIQKIFSDRFDMVSLSTGMRPCLDVDTLADVLAHRASARRFFRKPGVVPLPARLDEGGHSRRRLRHGDEAHPQLHRRRQRSGSADRRPAPPGRGDGGDLVKELTGWLKGPPRSAVSVRRYFSCGLCPRNVLKLTLFRDFRHVKPSCRI